MLSFFQNQTLPILLFQALLLLFIVSNAWILHRTGRHTPPATFPKVSVLIPARNEEKNIGACVESLLAQDYPHFEILVLDDQSSDGTRAILNRLAREHPELQVLAGSPAPDGRPGKNWACTQLAARASGELLFFTDADTRHQPQTLHSVVTAMQGERADMLTGFPRQEMGSWGERLLVPFFSWAFLCFTPLFLAYRLRLPALSSAVGQMMIFRRQAYEATGGHNRLGTHLVDDMVLARRIKAAGLRWRIMDITHLVSCRMYAGSQETFRGFAKNYFAAFGFRLIPYAFIFGWLAVLFIKPLVLLAQLALGLPTEAQLGDLLLCVGLALLLWASAYRVLRIPVKLAWLYPLTILAVEFVALQSLWLSLTGRLIWKERPLPRPAWKWL